MSNAISKPKPTVPEIARPIAVSIVEDDPWLRKDLAREISTAAGFRCQSTCASAE